MDLSLNNPLTLILASGGLLGLLLSWYVFVSSRVVTDQATSRSLHQGQAVTGGGLWMFVPVALFMIWQQPDFLPAYLLMLMSLLGFADDHYDLSFKPRLVVQLLIAVACLYHFGHQPGWFWLFLTLALIWWLNLFNFMDGANGMAGLHALVLLLFYALLAPADVALQQLIYTALGVVLVFLLFNLVLKRLFMGDSGSLPLAFLLAVLAFGCMAEGLLSYHQVALIHAVFITDATLTLLMRLKAGENITQAHASHLYQRIIKAYGSHATVSLGYAMITAVLCGLAWIMPKWPIWQQMSSVVGIYLILLAVFSKTLRLGR
jgi:UDP-N-acetylmuramyl pentapeptide phosphotransferase/UDP-N-acetylglucosamine-1-phosphate transferase